MTKWLLVALTAATLAVPLSAEEKPIKLDGFSLKDFQGKEYTLDSFKEQKLLVIVFVNAECPLAKLYGPKLAAMDKEYGTKGVAFIAADPNAQDGITKIAAFARTHQITFPVLKDLNNVLADKLGAQRTPAVFLLDAERIVRYQGRIDDQYGVGSAKNKPEKTELKTAIDELLAGKAVSTPETKVTGCLIGKVAAPKADASVTFSKHIAPILNARCVECHRTGDIAPFTLDTYEQAAGWSEMIREVVDDGRMPPWHADPKYGHFSNERRLTDAEKQLIRKWVDAGAPQGDPKDLPVAPKFSAGWQLSREPDAVVNMRQKPFEVPAEGAVKYLYFKADPGFTEDKWVTEIEVQPGTRSLVHHILVFVVPKGVSEFEAIDGSRTFLGAYVPGLRAFKYPPGMAKKIPADAMLYFEVHYTPNGSPHTDISRIGLCFTDPSKVKYEVKTTAAVGRKLKIPPGAADHTVEATTAAELPEVLLLSVSPHMHLRGKAFQYEAIYPDGKREILLDVPHYDFNWQNNYLLAEPKKLPPGTKIHCTAKFDNSDKNPNNPAPKATVRWGPQTWNEMMIGYFDVALPFKDGKSADITEPYLPVEIPAKGFWIPEENKDLAFFDKDKDGRLSKAEIEAIPELIRRRVVEFLQDYDD